MCFVEVGIVSFASSNASLNNCSFVIDQLSLKNIAQKAATPAIISPK